MQLEHKPIFIISISRSGSNYLASILREHPEITLVNEPFNKRLKLFSNRPFEIWNETTNINELMNENDFKYLSLLKKWFFESSGTRIIKETILNFKLNWLYNFFPNCYYVFLIRDPNQIYHSFLRNNLIKLWDIRNRLRVSPFNNIINNMDDREMQILLFKNILIEFISFIKKNTKNSVIVNYDALINNPIKEINFLLKKFHLPLCKNIDLEVCEKSSKDIDMLFSTFRNVTLRKKRYEDSMDIIEYDILLDMYFIQNGN